MNEHSEYAAYANGFDAGRDSSDDEIATLRASLTRLERERDDARAQRDEYTHNLAVGIAQVARLERERAEAVARIEEASDLLNRSRAWLAITSSAQAEKLVEAIDRWQDAALAQDGSGR
jgi:chromosome segregation ATPase